MGSARVSRAGDRVLAITDFCFASALAWAMVSVGKDCFGATPKPARGTRALPTIPTRRRAATITCS